MLGGGGYEVGSWGRAVVCAMRGRIPPFFWAGNQIQVKVGKKAWLKGNNDNNNNNNNIIITINTYKYILYISM